MSPAQAGALAAEPLARPGLGVLERVAGVLFSLADAGRPLATPEIAERAEIPSSTAYRLLWGLDRHGLVDRTERGSVELGLRLLELARCVEERIERQLVEPARGPMRRLAQEQGETALLTAAIGEQALCLATVESPRPMRLSYGRWRTAPIYLGASGKVLLAHLEGARRHAALADAAGWRGPDGRPVELDGLRRELAAIRAQGHVVTHGELDEGATGIAAPDLDRRGRLVAGLSVAGPTPRLGERIEALVAGVVEEARAVGGALDDVR